MSILSDFENEVLSLGHTVEDDFKYVGALAWKDIKVGASAAGSAFLDMVKAEMPKVVQWLKDEAQVCIALAEQQFGSYLSGDVKFNVALANLWQSIQTKAIPGLSSLSKDVLSQLFSLNTLKTLIQVAFAAVSVSVVA